jgi:hydrogenase maturation factor
MSNNNFDRAKKVAADLVTITPEQASAWLKTSNGNRKIRTAHVRNMASAMKRGEWVITHQGIAFDVTGALKDGHHRLNACVMSGVTIKSMVTRGLPVESTLALDIGASRSFGDRLNIRGSEAKIIRLGCEVAYGQGFSLQMAKPLIEGGLQDATKDLLEFCGTKVRAFSSAPVALAAVISALDVGDSTYAFTQYNALVKQLYDDMSSASKVFSKMVVQGHLSLGGGTAQTLMLAKALYVFDEKNKDVKTLRKNENVEEKTISRARATLRGLINNNDENGF